MTSVDRLHPRIQAVDVQTGVLTPFFYKWLVSVYNRIGGPDDIIEDIEYGELYEPGITDSRLITTQNDLKALQNDFDLWNTNGEFSRLERLIIELQRDFESSTESSRIAILESQFQDLQNELDMSPIWQTNNFFTTKVFSTSSNITTYDDCIVIATSNITVTLNSNPKDQEKVIVKRNTTAGTVTLSSSINIDGAATYSLLANYDAAHCVYSATDNEYFIV